MRQHDVKCMVKMSCYILLFIIATWMLSQSSSYEAMFTVAWASTTSQCTVHVQWIILGRLTIFQTILRPLQPPSHMGSNQTYKWLLQRCWATFAHVTHLPRLVANFSECGIGSSFFLQQTATATLDCSMYVCRQSVRGLKEDTSHVRTCSTP